MIKNDYFYNLIYFYLLSTMQITRKLQRLMNQMRLERFTGPIELTLGPNGDISAWIEAHGKNLGKITHAYCVRNRGSTEFHLVFLHIGVNSALSKSAAVGESATATRYWCFRHDLDEPDVFKGNQEGLINNDYVFPETLCGLNDFRQGEYYAHVCAKY
jgi:hypothetical protein